MAKRVSLVQKFWVKLTKWEFWPFSVLYFPVYFYYTWLAIRNRSFFFFTSSNPTIEFGGMLGERKSEIFELIPKKYLPEYQLILPGDLQSALLFVEKTGYPLIAKPDIGERGILVEKITDRQALDKYLRLCPVPFLLQEFIDYPVELGVFYSRYPGKSHGQISSIVQKEFLHVIGDGNQTVEALLMANPRAVLQMDISHNRFRQILQKVPSAGEKVIIEPIGNHCRGTMFIDATSEASEELTAAFDKLADQIDGFYFGRFDLRCTSFEELSNLNGFKILELNGAGSEPGHIYQPGFPLWKGYDSIFWHLKVLSQISRANQLKGHRYWSFSRGMKKLKMIRNYNRLINTSK